jgi:hypothetical protein
MDGATPPLPNTPSWRGPQLKAQGLSYLLYLMIRWAKGKPEAYITKCRVKEHGLLPMNGFNANSRLNKELSFVF